jgi:signal transduction histidine kinase
VFERARRRLALRYLALFVLVIAAFSLVFLATVAVVLQPAFDLVPENTAESPAVHAYNQAIKRIAVALAIADGVVIVAVGGAAYYLAGRTLRPIQEAHERQRRFVADASHEMRTPLAAIRSTAESALAQSGDAVGDEAALRTIVASSEELTGLTNDLLLLARSERGLLELRRERLDLSVLVAEIVEEAIGASGGTGRIALTLAPDLAVEADEHEIRRIVSNLVANALRYGTGRNPVQVRTLATDGHAIVEVQDSGPGIAAADLDRIFQPFYRVRPDAGAPSGSGLGLAIAADLAERNGGRLSVASRPGDGATFRLQLPRFT